MRYALSSPRRFLAACASMLALAPLAPLRAAADPAPVAIAVFDFELDDYSAAAGVAGDAAADAEQLRKAAVEARRVLAQSGRYVLVDPPGAATAAVKEHRLRECNGCEAAVALKLGADQSFLGLVTRISRTEYRLRFQIRDARTGELLLARQSDLRLGASYSWPRGTAALIKAGLFPDP